VALTLLTPVGHVGAGLGRNRGAVAHRVERPHPHAGPGRAGGWLRLVRRQAFPSLIPASARHTSRLFQRGGPSSPSSLEPPAPDLRSTPVSDPSLKPVHMRSFLSW
jgi:hypothetical protein